MFYLQEEVVQNMYWKFVLILHTKILIVNNIILLEAITAKLNYMIHKFQLYIFHNILSMKIG